MNSFNLTIAAVLLAPLTARAADALRYNDPKPQRYELSACKHCRAWHFHGPAEGHREAHCNEPTSTYVATGYNLALRGKASPEQLRRMKEA